MAENPGFIPTDEQNEILHIKDGIHLVLAPPGSGKTELLSQRVQNAKNFGYKDSEIICLTFTNRAAKGMKDRIDKKYPENEIIIGNIHHFCFQFLITNKLIPLNTSILDEEDSSFIIEELKSELNYPRDDSSAHVTNRDLISYATYLRQLSLKFPEEILIKPKLSEIPELDKAEILCVSYHNIKKEMYFLDFDDLLTFTYSYLIKTGKEYSYSNFSWLQVDEVQDLNPIQWEIINLITSNNALIVYFGDPEQAIFSFMGAKLESLGRIREKCKNQSNFHLHYLNKNFRSPSYLLEIFNTYANYLLSPSWINNPISCVTEIPEKGSLKIHRIIGKLEDEVRYLINEILLKFIQNKNEKTAILVRYNNTADIISKALINRGLPHFKISGFDLFQRSSIKGLIAFLSIIDNEFDKMSWIRIFFEFGNLETLKKSRNFIKELFHCGITPLDLLRKDGADSELIEFNTAFKSNRIIVLDTETTGLDTEYDDVIQIAAIELINGVVISEFEVYLKTEIDLTESEKVHKISKAFLDENGVSHEVGLDQFLDFLGENTIIVAHNLEFDYKILKSNLQRYRNINLDSLLESSYDSIRLCKLVYINRPSYKLMDLIKFLNIDGINSHNALDDVKATVALISRAVLDSELIITKQKDFLSNYANTSSIEHFLNKFSELYSYAKSNFEEYVSIPDVIDFYFNHLISYKLLYESDYLNVEKREIDKLKSHIIYYTKDCNLLTLKKWLKKYLPEYKTFKESDLLKGDEQIFLSTVYKAKGLEFDNVIIADATNSSYPSWNSYNDVQIREDARVLYVALTRARKRLHITSQSIFVTKYGTKKEREESPFLEPIKDYFEYTVKDFATYL